jgi:hypothetical protein
MDIFWLILMSVIVLIFLFHLSLYIMANMFGVKFAKAFCIVQGPNILKLVLMAVQYKQNVHGVVMKA